MAHAINGYPGMCKNIHGHSYQLHVTVSAAVNEELDIPAPGFLLDFKVLKQMVQQYVVQLLDHKLVLSKSYIALHSSIGKHDNLVLWDAEPTAENLLLFMKRTLQQQLPAGIQLEEMKLYETADSYAAWRR